jgi:predicted TIM-barrel fold metal-dependent hydrolase
MSHIFPNVWYDMSIMAPFVNRGLYQRLLETFETAPLSKVMYGSDAYHVPEFFYLGAKWAKRHVGKALATLVDDGVLTKDDAVRYARMILADNARRLHRLPI